MQATIPIFPLQTVLVPGGHLSLQIFEPRYLDMVRECSRDESGFGVCLVTRGTKTGRALQHTRIGTLARIRDFYTLENGLLGITTQGFERFRIEQTRMRDNGLLMADVSWLDEAVSVVLPEAYFILSRIVDRFMDKVGGNYPDFHPDLLEDAVWVGYRLTELLPMTNAERLELLKLNDALTRLQILLEMLPRFQADPSS
jgi:Lon protease-like protein